MTWFFEKFYDNVLGEGLPRGNMKRNGGGGCMYCTDYVRKSTTCSHFKTSGPSWMYQGSHFEQSDERVGCEMGASWIYVLVSLLARLHFRASLWGRISGKIWRRILDEEGVWVGQLMSSGLRRWPCGNTLDACLRASKLRQPKWVTTFLVSILCESLIVNPSHSTPRNSHSRVAVEAVVGEYGVWIYWSWDLNYAC
jgi:hypothetical protein